MQADAVDGRDVDRATDHFLHLLQFAVELVVEVENFLGGFIEFLTLMGESELLLAAIDDEDVEMLLHRT